MTLGNYEDNVISLKVAFPVQLGSTAPHNLGDVMST